MKGLLYRRGLGFGCLGDTEQEMGGEYGDGKAGLGGRGNVGEPQLTIFLVY